MPYSNPLRENYKCKQALSLKKALTQGTWKFCFSCRIQWCFGAFTRGDGAFTKGRYTHKTMLLCIHNSDYLEAIHGFSVLLALCLFSRCFVHIRHFFLISAPDHFTMGAVFIFANTLAIICLTNWCGPIRKLL